MIPISLIKQSQIKSNQTISTRQGQLQPVTISQIIKKIPIKQSLINKQVHEKHQALRDSQENKYVVEVFSYLNLQTKKSLDSNINNKNNNNRYTIPNPKNKQYLMEMPQTCQSLVKIEQPGQQVYQQMQTPTLKGTSYSQQQNKARKSNQLRFNVNDMQQVKQSKFNQNNNNNNNRSKPTITGGNKNKRVIKNQFNFEAIQDAPNSFYEQNHSTFNANGAGQSAVTSNIKNGGKRSSKQIKTFKIENIEQKKQSDFGGCCGFGIVDKISFYSRDN